MYYKGEIMPDTLVTKIYDLNKKEFHSRLYHLGIRGRELHHTCGRVGIRKACIALFVGLTKTEHNDWKVLKSWREAMRETERLVVSLYLRGEGCRKNHGEFSTEHCAECPMPKLEE